MKHSVFRATGSSLVVLYPVFRLRQHIFTNGHCRSPGRRNRRHHLDIDVCHVFDVQRVCYFPFQQNLRLPACPPYLDPPFSSTRDFDLKM